MGWERTHVRCDASEDDLTFVLGGDSSPEV